MATASSYEHLISPETASFYTNITSQLDLHINVSPFSITYVITMPAAGAYERRSACARACARALVRAHQLLAQGQRAKVRIWGAKEQRRRGDARRRPTKK
jgi:hypothetical protein